MHHAIRVAAMALSHIWWVTALPNTLLAQTIRVGENLRVARGLERRPLVEPHLAVHPSNPNHLLGATIVSDVAAAWGETQTCSSFLSLDGGTTWERHDFPITGCGDPWVAITPDGHAVLTALGAHKALTQQDGGGLVVFHSADGGRTWDEKPVGLGRGHDHQTVAIDMSSRQRTGWLYVVSGQALRADDGKLRWSVSVARSRNGGKRFDEPAKIVPSNLNINAELPAVLSDGTLIVSFVDFQRNVDGFSRGGRLDRRRVWVLRSTDGGHSFSVPLFASEACGPGWSALAADTAAASAFRDRTYLTCMQKGGGAIVLNYSPDGGETWTDPFRVHTAPVDTAVLRSTPAVAVNKNGVLGVAWIDGRIQTGKRCQELLFAASLDGGRTFLPEQRISSARSCPDSTVNGAAYNRWPTGGDYFGMAAAPDGQFHLLWADARAGVFQLWTAAVTVEGRAVERK
jgi:hypothetical protein